MGFLTLLLLKIDEYVPRNAKYKTNYPLNLGQG